MRFIRRFGAKVVAVAALALMAITVACSGTAAADDPQQWTPEQREFARCFSYVLAKQTPPPSCDAVLSPKR